METLKQYVYKRLDSYDRDKQCTIKCVLKYLEAEHVLAKDYCKLYLNKNIEEASSKEIIKHMVLNSPWGYCYKNNKEDETKTEVVVKKKKLLSFNEEFERDEIFNV